MQVVRRGHIGVYESNYAGVCNKEQPSPFGASMMFGRVARPECKSSSSRAGAGFFLPARYSNAPLPKTQPTVILPKPTSGKVSAGYQVRFRRRVLGAPENCMQRLTHFQPAIVVYESLLPESIHEQIDAWARGPDHFH
jgi:hypothetical protein